MPSAPQTYADWKAPAEDGQIIVWPPPDELLAETLENHRQLSSASDVRVQNVALSELRRRQREWLGHRDDAQPLLVDGHQTELYHAGVWVKSVLAHFAAERLGGSALHLAVDTDAPKHLFLRYPGTSLPITDDPDLTRAHWSGLLEAPSPRHLAELQSTIDAATFAQTPVVGEFLGSLRRLALEQPKLSPAITNAMHELDWDLGLRHGAALASPVWSAEPFLLFAHHLIARAGEVAAAYNRALAEYRREKKVRTPTRPMPDLAADGGAIELPFWLDFLSTGERIRPTVAPSGDGYVLHLAGGGDEFRFDASADGWDVAANLATWLRRHELRLSPRALVLTMFVRLCVADQFVHGIGGGQYDQITDRIIASHFNLQPPRFSVTTATMYLPEAVGRQRVCIPCINQEGHRLKHAVLGPQRKRELLAKVNAAPRRSSERYAAFAEMHREMKAAMLNNPQVRAWEQRLRDAREHEAAENTIFDRELFYAMQPRARLVDMIERYRSAFAAR
jgi:hypothetical protein